MDLEEKNVWPNMTETQTQSQAITTTTKNLLGNSSLDMLVKWIFELELHGLC